MAAMWEFDAKTKFKKQYRGLNPQTQKKVDGAIGELKRSENPAHLGKYKSNMRVFAFHIGRRYRIIYNIDWSNNTVELLRVCDHKSAYGKD